MPRKVSAAKRTSSHKRKSASKRSASKRSTKKHSSKKQSHKKVVVFAPSCPIKVSRGRKYSSSVKRQVRDSIASVEAPMKGHCSIKTVKSFNDHLKRMPLVSKSLKPEDKISVHPMCLLDAFNVGPKAMLPIYSSQV